MTTPAELGITSYELGDKIIPDFGFDGLFKTFKVGDEEYRAFIDSNFKFAFLNEANKKLKSIPAGAGKEIKEEFNAIGKEVKSIVKLQSPRLEYYLIIQRRWPVGQWQHFFLQNPVMFIYAIKILWGVYDGDKLLDTFIVNEDTSIQNMNGDEMELPEGNIGIVHPTQLSDGDLQKWTRYFYDNSIIPIFPQLQRPVPDIEGIDANGTVITKFYDKRMKTGSIRTTLEKYGWIKGPIGDGGYLDYMKLPYPEKKLEVILEVNGVAVSYGWSDDEKLGCLYVVDKAKAGKYFYVKDGTESFLLKFRDLPSIFLYEMLASIEAITQLEDTFSEKKN